MSEEQKPQQTPLAVAEEEQPFDPTKAHEDRFHSAVQGWAFVCWRCSHLRIIRALMNQAAATGAVHFPPDGFENVPAFLVTLAFQQPPESAIQFGPKRELIVSSDFLCPQCQAPLLTLVYDERKGGIQAATPEVAERMSRILGADGKPVRGN